MADPARSPLPDSILSPTRHHTLILNAVAFYGFFATAVLVAKFLVVPIIERVLHPLRSLQPRGSTDEELQVELPPGPSDFQQPELRHFSCQEKSIQLTLRISSRRLWPPKALNGHPTVSRLGRTQRWNILQVRKNQYLAGLARIWVREGLQLGKPVLPLIDGAPMVWNLDKFSHLFNYGNSTTRGVQRIVVCSDTSTVQFWRKLPTLLALHSQDFEKLTSSMADRL